MGNSSGAMDRNASIVWVAFLLQLFLMVSSTLSQTSESPPPNSQAGRCSRNLQQTFDPLMNSMVENIRQELVNFQQTQGSQGTSIMISNENDLATLVAEKLYVKIKEDLITSGNGIINEEVTGLKERIDVIEETIEESKVSSDEQFESLVETSASNTARIQVLENDKPNKIYFSAYNDEGGHVTGQLMFPKVITNLGSAFDASSGVFTAPVKGVYTFSFSGQQSSYTNGGEFAIDLYVKKNDATVFGIYDDRNSNGENQKYQNINSIFSLDLIENDKVKLVLDSSDKLYASGNMRLIFMGQLVVAT